MRDHTKGIIGALFITCLIAGAFSLSGCAQPASGDEVERAGKAAVEKALGELDKPQESAAPPVEVPPPPVSITEPHIDPQPMKYMPPEDDTPSASIRFFTQRGCVPCVPAEREIERFGEKRFVDAGWTYGDYRHGEKRYIHIVRYEDHPELFDEFGISATPAYIKLVNGKKDGSVRVGPQTREQLVQWLNAPATEPFFSRIPAPEVATQRPFAEAWRQELARKHGRRAMGAHTDLDAETVALPETRINLRAQCVEFSGPSRVSQLNRWFSVSFGAGNVSHSGSTVTFSNPPELRFHLFENGAGEKLDSLKAIEFVDGGAAFDLVRFGRVRFGVK